MTIHTSFNTGFHPNAVFKDERSIRARPNLFRAYCYERLQQRRLPLSAVSLNSYLMLVGETDQELRKDKSTARILHELGHMDVMDRLLFATDNAWIDEENYGSIDALFTAIILHDVIEDFNISPQMLEEMIGDNLESLSRHLGSEQKLDLERAFNDLKHAMDIVVLLSRKDAYGMAIPDIGNSRLRQAERWLEHPYAFPIKQIDWCSKLQAMAGVAHFEKDGYLKMDKVLDETAFLFVTEQQNFTGQAITLYPQLEEPCRIMEGFMGPMFQMLRTYKAMCSERVHFHPEDAKPYNFDNYLAAARPLLRHMLTGNNYLSPFIERLEAVAQEELDEMDTLLNDSLLKNVKARSSVKPKVGSMLKHMIRPAFSAFSDNISSISSPNP